jgi:hypothetical protein
VQDFSNCSLVQALHSSHKLGPFSSFFQPSHPPLTYPTFLTHPLLYCITHFRSDFLLFDATYYGPFVFFYPLHVVRICTPGLQSHPIAEPLVLRIPRAPFLHLSLSHAGARCPFLSYVSLQHNVWLRLIS